MTITPDSLRSDLAGLAADGAKAAASGGRIVEAAQRRREEVTAEMDRLRPTVLTDDQAADQYMRLTAERGQLDMVLARS